MSDKHGSANAAVVEALRGTEEPFRLLVHAVQDYAIIMLDPDGRIVTWNEGARRLKGYQESEIVGESMERFYSPDDIASGTPKHLLQLAVRDGRCESEGWRVRKDGSRFFADVVLTAIFNARRELVGFAKVTRDVTQRRESERLRAQVEQTEALLEAVPDAVLIMDRERRIKIVNARTQVVFGYPRADLLGQSIDRLVPAPLPVFGIPDPTLAPGLPGEQTMVLRDLAARRRDGSGFTADVSLSPLVLPSGPLTIATVRDVSDRHAAERKIRAQLEHLTLLDHITRAIAERQDLRSIFQVVVSSVEDSLPADFCCICLHDGATKLLQVSCVGSKNRTRARELALEERASFPVDENGLSRCMRGTLVYEPNVGNSHFPFTARMAASGLCSLVLAPLRSEDRSLGILITARTHAQAFTSDECEFLRQLSQNVALAAHQAQLYEALKRAYDDLRQTQQVLMQEERLRAIGQMASGVAHDVNNALSPASLLAQILLRTEPTLSPAAREHLTTIQRAVDDVSQTVSRIREFSRRREADVDLKPANMNDMVRQVIELTRPRWSNVPQERGIRIRMSTELALDLPKILCVESEIREALTNLVFNAVDAMPEGGSLLLRTRALGTGGKRGAVAVEVVDSGNGMDEETRQRCLEPFFTTKGERGTGLGLAMVYGVAQRHSADLEIDSAPGRGTTMRLTFPVSTGPSGESQAGSPTFRPRPLRLLLVDDDPAVLKTLRYALEADGHMIMTADGGAQAMELLRSRINMPSSFQAVLTDLGMPGIDGRQLAAAVKQLAPGTPVLLVTGWGKRLDDDAELPPNVDRLLSKPPKLHELREALASLYPAAD